MVGINDESAVGAVEAAKQAGGGTEIAIVGHGGSGEITDIVANPDSPCIGTVFFHAERYGTDLLDFALPIVRGRSAPVVHSCPMSSWEKMLCCALAAKATPAFLVGAEKWEGREAVTRDKEFRENLPLA